MRIFHGPIYFSADQIERAAEVRQNLAKALSQLSYTSDPRWLGEKLSLDLNALTKI